MNIIISISCKYCKIFQSWTLKAYCIDNELKYTIEMNTYESLSYGVAKFLEKLEEKTFYPPSKDEKLNLWLSYENDNYDEYTFNEIQKICKEFGFNTYEKYI